SRYLGRAQSDQAWVAPKVGDDCVSELIAGIDRHVVSKGGLLAQFEAPNSDGTEILPLPGDQRGRCGQCDVAHGVIKYTEECCPANAHGASDLSHAPKFASCEIFRLQLGVCLGEHIADAEST